MESRRSRRRRSSRHPDEAAQNIANDVARSHTESQKEEKPLSQRRRTRAAPDVAAFACRNTAKEVANEVANKVTRSTHTEKKLIPEEEDDPGSEEGAENVGSEVDVGTKGPHLVTGEGGRDVALKSS
ncbi:hypothetical protein H6P81_016414 [Aristolochia fimbriata]|uniref:Uncharacterized protein n=1 Tax=Aristolochia fimbriata TaxID=158543 RepID=A0AAV7E9X7_ARIFI|nr:hypothetical protein H6P81_016414 [Aristolochia fimbriata]